MYGWNWAMESCSLCMFLGNFSCPWYCGSEIWWWSPPTQVINYKSALPEVKANIACSISFNYLTIQLAIFIFTCLQQHNYDVKLEPVWHHIYGNCALHIYMHVYTAVTPPPTHTHTARAAKHNVRVADLHVQYNKVYPTSPTCTHVAVCYLLYCVHLAGP